jgi:hypothetical protein
MMLDSSDFVGATDLSEKDDVAFISAETTDIETDQLHELPRADDCMSTPTVSLATYDVSSLVARALANMTGRS